MTLKSNWHPHRESVRDDVSTSTRKLVTDQSGTRDVRGYTTGDQTSARRLVRDPEPATDKKPQFEIDLRVFSSQGATLQDEE